MARTHKQHTTQVVFDRARHALHGLPTCAFCHKDFTRWEGLSAHIMNRRCAQFPQTLVFHPPDSDLGDAPAAPTSSAPAEVLPQVLPAVAPTIAASAVPAPTSPPSSVTLLLATEVLQHLQTGGTAALLRSSCMHRLANYCGLCGQWHAHSQTLKLHYRSLHAAAFQLDGSARKLAPRLGAAFNPCLYCDESRTHPKQHIKHCTALWQALLLALHHGFQLDPNRSADGGGVRASSLEPAVQATGGLGPVCSLSRSQDGEGSRRQGIRLSTGCEGEGEGSRPRPRQSQSQQEQVRGIRLGIRKWLLEPAADAVATAGSGLHSGRSDVPSDGQSDRRPGRHNCGPAPVDCVGDVDADDTAFR